MKPKVLIVEDELITAMEFKEALVDADFEVPIIADRISKAKVAFQSTTFDLVLLDITLKYDLDNGLDLAEWIRKTSNIPIMFITGDTNETILQRINSLGNCNYMMKAVRTPELIFKSKMMLGNKDVTASKRSDKQDFVLLTINKSHKKIRKADIVAIKGNGSYSDIFIVGENHFHTLSMNIKKLLEGLSYDGFYRLSRSHVVNLSFIEKIEKDRLFLSSHGLIFGIPKGIKSELLEILNNLKT
jgi:DNA-binding LytR/AlgR family response regulator